METREVKLAFDTTCMDVLRISYCYALAYESKYIYPSHIALAILRTDVGLKYLKDKGLDFETFKERLEKQTEHGCFYIKHRTEFELSDDLMVETLGGNNTAGFMILKSLEILEEKFNRPNTASELANIIGGLTSIDDVLGEFLGGIDMLDIYVEMQQSIDASGADYKVYGDFNKVVSEIGADFRANETEADEDETSEERENSDFWKEALDIGEQLLYDYWKRASRNTVYGCEAYAKRINEAMFSAGNRCVAIVGPSGVGKTSIVDKYVQMIACEELPHLWNFPMFIGLDTQGLLAMMVKTPAIVSHISNLLSGANDNTGIVVIDDADVVFCDRVMTGILNRSIQEGTRIILTATDEGFNKFIASNKQLLRRIDVIRVNEMTAEESAESLKKFIKSIRLDVKIPNECVDTAAKLSDRYIKDCKMPAKLEKVIFRAIAKTMLDGRKTVRESDVLEVISDMSSVDINKLGKSETKSLLTLEKTIGNKLIGQDRAVKVVADAVRRGKAGVCAAERPISSMLFTGPTGVGKTELCKLLVETLGYTKEQFIRLDMSEYKEKYTVSKLIGSAPGYVGHDEGGQLTEKVKNNPYSVVLFDEIEKADASIYDLMLQILDDGRLTDSKGNAVDFSNCIVIMTSNAGYGVEQLERKTMGFGVGTSSKGLSDEATERIVTQALENTFKPEFLNRIDEIVLFNRLGKEECNRIAELELNKLADTVRTQGYEIKFKRSIVNEISNRGYSEKYGARNIKRQVQTLVANKLATEMLSGEVKKKETFVVAYGKDGVTVQKETHRNASVGKKKAVEIAEVKACKIGD